MTAIEAVLERARQRLPASAKGRRLLYLVLGLTLAAAVVFTVSGVLAGDLLSGDGGFDSGTQWNAWSKLGSQGGVTYTQDTSAYQAGRASAELSGSIAARQAGTLAGYLSHPVQVDRVTDSLQLTLYYRKNISGTPTSVRIYWELWGLGTSALASADLDTSAGSLPDWTAKEIGLSGLGLQPGQAYSLRLGYAAAYGWSNQSRSAAAWFDSVSLVADLEPPATTLVSPSPAAGSYQEQTALVFTWQGSDNATPADQLAYQYSADGSLTWSPWVVGQTQATVTYSEGAGRSFAVRARDSAGNVGAVDQRTFTVDLTPSAASIQSGLTDGTASNSASQTFSWTGLDNLSAADALRFEYSTDGGLIWSPAGPALEATVSYNEGTGRTFDVRAIDQAGHTGPAAHRTFTIDLTGPAVRLLSGPDGGAFVNTAVQSFTWEGSDQPDAQAALTYQHSSDGGATWSGWSPAVSTTVTFPEGPVRLDIRARDPAGNIGPATPASFVVDLTPPAVAGLVCTPGITDAVLTFSTVGDASRASLRYGTTPGQPVATAVEGDSVENHRLTLAGLQPNTTYYYTLEVTDGAGNKTLKPEASFGTLPDNLPPDTAITAGPSDGSWQKGPVLTFDFSGTDNVTPAGALRYSCSSDGGQTWSPPAAATSVQVGSYPEGTNLVFLVRALDEAGNADPTPAQRTFHVDRTAPLLALAGGPADGSFATTTTPQFSWTATDAMTEGPGLIYATSVDGGQTWSSWSTGNSAQPTYAEGKGRTFAVKARDPAGNQSTPIVRTFHVDVTGPAVAITGGLDDGAISNISRHAFTWHGTDNVSSAAALQFSTSLDGGTTWSAWSGATQGEFDLPDGRDLTFQTRAKDEASHVSAPASRRFTVDTRPPVIAGTTLKAKASSADLSWTTAWDPSTSVVRWGTQPGVYTSSVSDPRAAESHAVTLGGLQSGVTYHYVIESTDPAGNTASTAVASFTTPAAIPHVIATVPESGDPGAGTAVHLKAYFDLDMNPATITAQTFYLVDSATGATVAVSSVSYDVAARAAVLVPAADLTPKTGYQATVTTGVASAGGQHLSTDYVWSFTTGLTAFPSPHGEFTTSSSACKACHNTHSSPAAALLTKADVTSLCFTCHDGSGSSLDVKGDFTGAAGSGSFHPVKNLPVVSESLLNCSDCHNPHGDKRPDGSLYPRLLRVVQADGSLAFSGNAVCLSCHGPGDRRWSATYWADSAGDHTNSTAAHYQNFAALIPASGTGITCVSCHDSHATPSPALLKQDQPEVCLGCHENTANSQSGRNIREEFSGQGTVSRHDVYGTNGAALACSSCHGPHTAAQGSLAGGTSQTELSNPQNTKQDMAAVTTGTTAARRYTDFCLSCHNGNTPVKLTSPVALVPVTIVYPNRLVTTNAGGGGVNEAQRTWNKAAYAQSAHYQAGLGCSDCHTAHGSANSLLQSRTEDTTTTATAGMCGRCHAGTPPAEFATAPNVWTDLTQADDAHRHPALTITGQHQDTENLSTQPRHSECIDCHDPHTATKAAPALNVSGVQPSWGTAWSTPSYTLQNPATAGYQVCLKCHSSYAFGSTPPVPTGGVPATDVAREINPGNPSYHSGVGATKIRTFTASDSTTHYYGKFAPNWLADSPVSCDDCHGSTTGIKGPHGSPNTAILVAPFNPVNSGTGTGTSSTQGDLCFKCHDYNFYASGSDQGSDTVRSQFSGGSRNNLHALGQHRQRGCTTCHVAVPHGWSSRSLVADIQANPDKPAPYFSQSKIRIYNWAEPGQWQESDCGGCHDRNW